MNVEKKNSAIIAHADCTLLYDAAWFGHYEIFKLIFENVEDKNPPENTGMTPLHVAAMFGNFDICKLILENIHVMNPPTTDGCTPFGLALSMWNLRICFLIFKNVISKYFNLH